jgi:predicted phage terminase large subunit-like protein
MAITGGSPVLAGVPTLDLVQRLSPEYSPPYHLADWCTILDRARSGEPVRAGCAIPVRHYKSQTTMHGIVGMLCDDPTIPVILLTHSHGKAMSVGKRIRELARAAGVGPARGYDTIEEWKNDQGGGVVVMSAEQSKLGYDCGALVYDDPLDEHGAENAVVRDAVDGTIVHYTARCMRRGKPGPVLGVMSRWHRDDPFGRRLLRTATPFEYIHHSVVEDEGTDTERAFAPAVWDLPALRQVRAELAEKDPTEKIWWAQFMNLPITTGGDLFHEATRYTELPTWAYRVAHGTDFAFSQGQHADFYAHVSARWYGRKLYLLEVRRERINPVMIESVSKDAIRKHGRAPIYSYQSGPEIGLTRVLQERGVPLVSMQARYSKLVRAERTIKRWNDGDILTPEDSAALWVPGFLSRVAQFTGNESDDGDDEIDALVSLHDGSSGSGVGAPRVLGSPRI